MIDFKGRHTPKAIILQLVRWYVSYALSYRDLEEMSKERGIEVDHSTIQRWVMHFAPQLEKAFHLKKRPCNSRWRMDETYIKVKGQWKYYYRAVDSEGRTIDFLLTAKRDKKAALRFFRKSIGRNEAPTLVNIDKSGANLAGLQQYNEDHQTRIEIRQCKYMNNVVEQDHRRIKRLTKPMMGFKNFHAAQKTLAGIELMAMLRKGQMKTSEGDASSPVEQFYALAA
jgi:transposase-like protein